LRERATAERQATEAKTRSLMDLTDRAQSATAGEQYAINNARKEYGQTKRTLSSKLTDLLGQRGNLVTTELGKLNASDAEAAAAGEDLITSGAFAGMTKDEVRALSPAERTQITSDYNNRGKKGDKGDGKKSRASQDKIEKLSSNFSRALAYAKDYNDRATAAEALVKGLPDKVDQYGVRQPGTGKPALPQFAVSLALDMIFGDKGNKYISQTNVKRLHDLGYKVTDLPGAVGYNDWLQKRRTLNRPGTAKTRDEQPG